MGFGPGDVCGGPLLALQFTSARVQSRFEFVELGGDMYMYSNYQEEALLILIAVSGITG